MARGRKGNNRQDAKAKEGNSEKQKTNAKQEGFQHNSRAQEFPILQSLGLYAADTLGDGNCLFRAMSDQLYGDEHHHKDLRAAAIKEMVANKELYEAFAGAEYGETFDVYVSRMSRDGCYGGHLEIACFAAARQVEVAIYQADSVWILRPPSLAPEFPVQRLHIAYHSWEHYSSVRNLAGPTRGLPCVEPRKQISGGCESSGQSTAFSGKIPQWQLELALRTIEDADPDHVSALILELGYDQAVEKLLLDQADRDALLAADTLKPECTNDDLPVAECPPQSEPADKTLDVGLGDLTLANPDAKDLAQETQALSRKQLARRAREQRLKEARERKASRQRAKKSDKPAVKRGSDNVAHAKPAAALESEIYI